MRTVALPLALHIVAYGLASLLIAALFLGFMGVINLLYRRPFREGWRKQLLLLAVAVVADKTAGLFPVGWRVPLAVGCGAVLLVVMIWVMRRPGKVSGASDTEAGQSAA